MSTFLGRHFDATLNLDRIGSREEIEAAQIDRITRALTIVVISQTIPRRLGGDATDGELALDKKRARRVAHALRQALHGWTKKQPKIEATDETRREGAQLDWASWQPAFSTEVSRQLQIVATYALAKKDESWGKSAVVKLENELSWIEYALRD